MTKNILSLTILVLAMSVSSIALVLAVNVSTTGWLQSRIVEKVFDAKSGQRVELNLKFGDQIVIHTWDRSEVLFRATVEVNGGRLNDALLIDFNTAGSIRIDVDFDKDLIKQGRLEDCPDRQYSHYTYNHKGEGQVICSDISYEIILPGDTDLHVETISADIELIGLEGPVSAKSISGFVDMSWMGREGAELSMKTISGSVYSDLENIQIYNRDKQAPVGVDIRAKAGSGGTSVWLESISGDIFLRRGI